MILRMLVSMLISLASLRLVSQVAATEAVLAPLPKQVWSTLKEARRAAAKNERSLVVFVPEDRTRQKAALDFFQSLEGMKARVDTEVWLVAPGDPAASRLLDELGLRSLPVLASLTPSGKQALRFRLGEDCVPLASAFEDLFKSRPVSPVWLRDWVGRDQAIEPFLVFAADREKDLGAGRKEPHRTWLMGLLQGKDVRLRNWAATRLVEANALVKEKEPRPFPVLVKLLNERFEEEVRRGNRIRSDSPETALDGVKEPSYAGNPNPPMLGLGYPGKIPDKAPCWTAIREMLQNSKSMIVNVPIYVLMAPKLQEADKGWILLHLAREAKAAMQLDAQDSPLYWIATDWLLVYGRPGDWIAFRAVMVPLKWAGTLDRLMDTVKKIAGYWDSEPGMQSLFCDGETQESFWEHPDACLASWGITREALVEFGMDRMKSKSAPSPPRYPEDARLRRFSTTLRLRMVVGPDGNTKWVRPEPGFALSFFAPNGMAYAMRWRFEPARVAGVARPSQFILTMPFALR